MDVLVVVVTVLLYRFSATKTKKHIGPLLLCRPFCLVNVRTFKSNVKHFMIRGIKAGKLKNIFIKTV